MLVLQQLILVWSSRGFCVYLYSYRCPDIATESAILGYGGWGGTKRHQKILVYFGGVRCFMEEDLKFVWVDFKLVKESALLHSGICEWDTFSRIKIWKLEIGWTFKKNKKNMVWKEFYMKLGFILIFSMVNYKGSKSNY